MHALLALLLALLAAPLRAQEVPAHGGPVRAVVAAGDSVASAGFDQAVIFWDPASGRARAVARWHQGAVHALAALPDGGVASAGEDARIALWPARPGAAPARVLEGHAGPIAALAVRADGALLSAAWDGTARLWQGDAVAVLEGHQGQVNGAAFRSDGVPVTAGYDGTLRAWPPGEPPRVLAEFGLPQHAVVALPAGGLAVAGADGVLRLVAADGAVRELGSGGRPIVSLAASPDGATLAAASLGGDVRLWDVASGRLRHTLEGPGLPVWSVAFGPDGATVWTGGADRRVRRWDAASGRPVAPLGAEPAATAEARAFRACAACHALSASAGPMAGPHLAGLFGRRMGSVPGYLYSERLARGDIVWTRETVADLFTRGPDVVTPGTRMPVQRLEQAEEMRALLDFLAAAGG